MSAVQAESCCAVERREGLCCLMLESSLGRKKRFLPEQSEIMLLHSHVQ